MTNAISQRSYMLSVALSVLLLVPGVGLAAEEPSLTPEPVPGTAPRAPLHLVETQQSAEPVQSSNPVVRVLAELGAELATSFVAAFPGAFAGYVLCNSLKLGQSGFLSFGCWDYAGYGFLAGAAVAAPLGVWWGGKLLRGKGTVAGAYLGSGIGAVLGLGAMLLVYNDDIRPFVIPTGAMLGAIVGYEVSHHQESSARASSLVSVQPVLAVSASGGALGMSGRF